LHSFKPEESDLFHPACEWIVKFHMGRNESVEGMINRIKDYSVSNVLSTKMVFEPLMNLSQLKVKGAFRLLKALKIT